MAKCVWTGATNSTYTTATNWAGGSAPSAGDDVLFTNSTISVTASDQSGTALNSFTVDKSYTGSFGASTPTYLYIDAPTVNLGTATADGNGQGSRRLNLKIKTAGTVVNVLGSANSASDTGSAPTRLISAAAFVLNVFSGIVGVALDPSETCTVTTLTQNGGTVTLGAGVTNTTTNIYAGTLNDLSANAHTTVNAYGSSNWNYRGTGAITTLTIGSTAFHSGSGTITTLNVQGSIDFTGGNTATTITNSNIYSGAILKDNGRLTLTNPIKTVACTLDNVTIVLGYNRSYQVS